jgi:aquacobalamin reductase/NAD(P)H-flavin reductase
MSEQFSLHASNKVLADVVSIEALTAGVRRVRLKPQEPVHYLPGQYLQIFLSDSDKRPFSIASAPGDEFIELQIGGNVTDAYASQALTHLQDNPAVLIQVGLGEAYLRPDSNRPVLLLAGGTGFSYVCSIAKALAQQPDGRPVQLYWGLRNESALYYQQELAELQEMRPGLELITVLQEPTGDWTGRTGLVHEALLADIPSLAGYDIYIAGPFPMVKAVRDAFLAAGAERGHMYADAFAWI